MFAASGLILKILEEA